MNKSIGISFNGSLEKNSLIRLMNINDDTRNITKITSNKNLIKKNIWS